MENQSSDMEKFINVMRRLRAKDGCPWDSVQTHKSLKMCTMEECAELMDAIEDDDIPGMREELGDILMHVVLHSVIAEEEKAFTFADVVRDITEKMIRRHPHVFGSDRAENTDQVLAIWEAVKKEEKSDRKSILDGIPRHAPALYQAAKMQKKAAKVGFDWTNQADILAKIREELDEVTEAVRSGDEEHTDEEIGDLLFAVSNLARFRKRKNPEELLADANGKFQRRFRYIESELAKQNIPLAEAGIDRMEALWQEAKKSEPQQKQ